jgi:hypothetical protein
MKKKLAVVALSLMTALSSIVPAQAFPSVSPPKIEAPKDVEQVQYWRHRRGWDGRRSYYRDRYYGRRHYRRGPSAGAIIGGLAAGAIIGGALAAPRYAEPRYVAPRRYVSGGSAHVNWCYSRYRSYRAYDNSFQPYNGPRQQCYSPYS